MGGNDNNNRWVAKPSKEMMDYLEKAGLSGRIIEPIMREMPRPAGADNGRVGISKYSGAFEKWTEKIRSCPSWPDMYRESYDMVGEFSPLPVTENEIQKLLDAIPYGDKDYAGVFISYCVNEVYPYDEIRLTTNKPIGRLGALNTRKKWAITGDVGPRTGSTMSGGEIVIDGHSGDELGSDMSGGRIIMDGNAGGHVGERMTGGEIHLNGDYYSLGDLKGGRVYHNGHNLSELRAKSRR